MKKSTLAVSLLLAILLAAAPASTVLNAAGSKLHHWKLYQNGEAHLKQGKIKLAISELEQAVSQSEQAGYLRKLAEAYEQDRQYQKAADTYYREAKIHQKLGQQNGDLNTYYAVLAKADALNTDIGVYVETNGRAASASGAKLAKFEPESGMYIGAYIDKDSKMKMLGGDMFNAFNKLTGKQHAIYFTYHRYGSPFPEHWAETVKRSGGAVQLAFQPDHGLDSVKDDAYLRQFARAAKAAGVPVFLRFASEMNGGWVKWNGNPKQYIEKFRLVAKVMREEADNVAMVWSPAANPKQNIKDYYPGDEWVDWVGMSMYSVKYFNGKVTEPADQVNPLDTLDYIYRAYSARKPIMISEYAATHYSKAISASAVYFAQTKMNMLYHGVKLKYPRLKAIHWFSLNTLTDSHSADRSLNNFSLTENDKVLSAYSKMIQDPYYLSSVKDTRQNNSGSAKGYTKTISKLSSATKIGTAATGMVWVKTYDPYISKVVVKLNGNTVLTKQQYPYTFALDPAKLPSGTQKLEIIVFDSKGKEAAGRNFTFQKG